MNPPDEFTWRRIQEIGAKETLKTASDYAHSVETGESRARSVANGFNSGPWVDSAQIKTLHWAAYKDIYPWAGQFRQIELWNQKESRFHSAPQLIHSDLRSLNTCSREWFRSGDLHKTAREIAAYNTALHKIHPFLDGNFVVGKTILEHQTRELFGKQINLNQDEAVYRSALKQANAGNFSQLERQILEHCGLGRQADAMRAEKAMQDAARQLREREKGMSHSW